jgi:hypothetical protein
MRSTKNLLAIDAFDRPALFDNLLNLETLCGLMTNVTLENQVTAKLYSIQMFSRTEAFPFIALNCLKLNFAPTNATVHVQKIDTCTRI